LDFILAKANSYEGVITRIITGEPEPEVVATAVTEENAVDPVVETKKEEVVESAAGLSSLF